MQNTTWAEEHLELARKGQNSADGTDTCRLFTIGSIFVSFFYSPCVSFIFFISLSGLLYNAMKDQYKVISDGEKVDSGSWSDNPYVSTDLSKL
jgi:hypothetical protein